MCVLLSPPLLLLPPLPSNEKRGWTRTHEELASDPINLYFTVRVMRAVVLYTTLVEGLYAFAPTMLMLGLLGASRALRMQEREEETRKRIAIYED